MRCRRSERTVWSGILVLGVIGCLSGWGCRFDKHGTPSSEEPPLECGNGMLDSGEACDGTALGGQTCEDQGFFGGGTLACTGQCAFDVSDCQEPEDCGNHVREDPEQCDATDLGGETCVSLGFDYGLLACTDACAFDTQGCVGDLCGNGVIDPGESCDLTALGGESCVTLLHDGGTLTCNTDCTFNASECLDEVPGWYDVAWPYRKTITIHASRVVQDESEFAVAVLLPSDADLQANAQSDGDDLLFLADDGSTKLNHEIEVYNGATGALVAWVKVPLLSSTTDTLLYLYYGNATASNQQSPPDVWDGEFTGVYHLVGDGAVDFVDSSGSDNHASPANFSGDLSLGGKLGPAQALNGTDQYIEIPAGATDGHDHFTYCLWVSTSENGSDGTYWHRPSLFGQSTFGLGSNDFGITTNGGVLGLWTGLETFDDHDSSTESINDQVWHRVCAVNDGADIWLHLDDLGSVVSVPSGGDVNNQAFWLGGRAGEGGGGDFHQGHYDELQISSTNRTDGWLETSYRNQAQPQTFYTVGNEQYYLE